MVFLKFAGMILGLLLLLCGGGCTIVGAVMFLRGDFEGTLIGMWQLAMLASLAALAVGFLLVWAIGRSGPLGPDGPGKGGGDA